MIQSSRVVVIGSTNLDLAFRTPRCPEPGETVIGAEFTQGLGGKGANQAVAAARLGAEVSLVSCIGGDQAGIESRELFESEGIDSTGCTTVADEMTGRACVWIHDAENRILVSSGASEALDRNLVARNLEAIPAAAVLLCQLETPSDGLAYALSWAREVGARSILNAAPAASFESLDIVPDVLIANEREARQIAGACAADGRTLASRVAHQLQISTVVVTLGAAGAWLWHEGTEDEISAPSVAAVDSTAAGDAFCGAFAARLAAGHGVADAAAFAAAAGALTTLHFGAAASLPTLRQVEGLRADLEAIG